jgi:hypothetical protein
MRTTTPLVTRRLLLLRRNAGEARFPYRVRAPGRTVAPQRGSRVVHSPSGVGAPPRAVPTPVPSDRIVGVVKPNDRYRSRRRSHGSGCRVTQIRAGSATALPVLRDRRRRRPLSSRAWANLAWESQRSTTVVQASKTHRYARQRCLDRGLHTRRLRGYEQQRNEQRCGISIEGRADAPVELSVCAWLRGHCPGRAPRCSVSQHSSVLGDNAP